MTAPLPTRGGVYCFLLGCFEVAFFLEEMKGGALINFINK